MKLKPTRRLLVAGGLLSILVLVLLATGAYILPVFMQSRLIPRLAAEFGLAPGQVQVRRIGVWGADLGPIRLDSRQAGVLTLAAVQVDYTPWSLLRGRIDGITLGGVGVSLEATPGGVSLAGWRPSDRKKTPPSTGETPDLAGLLPIGLDHVTVLQSRIEVLSGGRTHVFPMEMRLETADLNRGILRGQARLSIFGNPLTLTGAVDQRANRATLHIGCDRFLLEALCSSGLLPQGTALSGILDIKGDAVLQLYPVALTGLQISGRLVEIRLAAAGAILENMVDDQGEQRPMAYAITAEGPDHRIQLSGGPFRIDGLVRTGATAFKATWVPGSTGWSLDGRLDTLIPRQTIGDGFTWDKDLPLTWDFRLVRGAADAVDFQVTSVVRHPWAVERESLLLAGDAWDLQCSGRFSGKALKADATWTTGPLRLGLPGQGSLKISGVKAGGTLFRTLSSNPEPSRVNVQALLSDVGAVAASTAVTLPGIQFQAEGRSLPRSAWNLQGRLTLSDGRIQDKTRQVDIRDLSLDLPLFWPTTAKASGGRLRIGSMRWEGRRLGGVQGTLQQKGRTIQVHLEHRSKLFEDLRVLMDGSLDAGGLRADVRIPAYQPTKAVDLGRLVPAAAGFQVGGRLEAHGMVTVTEAGPRGRADLAIDQGFVSGQLQKIRLDGIAMTLGIDDIAVLKSAPRQKLRVASLQWGDLRAQNLDVDFQMEDRRTLFLEKVGLKWCRGSVNTAAVRIFAGKEDYDVTLFCDRLDLAMVLEQLGAAEAGGDGTVNGRIPLRWTDGRLSFDNGFLYSTPGRSGKIQLKGTRELLVGIPPGTPQYTQLDIATEALKDYTYQWAKLNVQSDGDKLLLKLQLDGKPNRLLPFAYNQEAGQFIRISGEGQAEFKGIGVDLNFNIPLNEIIHYKDLLHK